MVKQCRMPLGFEDLLKEEPVYIGIMSFSELKLLNNKKEREEKKEVEILKPTNLRSRPVQPLSFGEEISS